MIGGAFSIAMYGLMLVGLADVIGSFRRAWRETR